MIAPQPQPVAFFGHGSPLNTIADNAYTRAWRGYGDCLPAPSAIVVISAHWYVPGTRISAARRPVTVHDFNARFAPELFAFNYAAPTDHALVERLVDLLAPARPVRDASTWGIDHGAYSILARLFPAADIPVVQVSIDRTWPARDHYALAKCLEPLRDEGVFVMGSGNIVHNLELGDLRSPLLPYNWAERFDERVAELVATREHEPLIAYHTLGADARLSVPTPDHYLPLLYVLALQREGEGVSTIARGFDFRSVSMRSVSIGP